MMRKGYIGYFVKDLNKMVQDFSVEGIPGRSKRAVRRRIKKYAWDVICLAILSLEKKDFYSEKEEWKYEEDEKYNDILGEFQDEVERMLSIKKDET